MANVLQDNLNEILQEKESKVLPENIKKGVTIFGVSGALTAGEGVMTEEDYEICEELADIILGNALPYTELEYIQSSGTQWIDTLVGANATSLKYEAKFLLPTGATDGFLWSQWNNNAYGLGDLYNDKTVNKMCYFYKNTYATISSPGFTYDTEYVISSDMNLTKIETVLNGISTTQTRTANVSPYSIKLFRRGDDTSRYWGVYRLYYLKIHVDGVLARDFIPVKSIDGKTCLYDKVSGEFFYNQSATDFIAGPEINNVKHITLEYIQSTGTQWLDTEYVPNHNTSYEITLSDVNTANEYVIFGTNEYNSGQDLLVEQFGEIRWYYPVGMYYKITSDVTTKATITCYRGTTTYNGTTISNATATNGKTNTTNLYLCKCLGRNVYASFKLYSFKVYDNGDLVRDFVPVKDLSGRACLYDNITERYYYSGTNDDFVAGGEI